MSSTSLLSFLPAINMASSFSSLLSSGYLPIPSLPYWNIKKLLETLSKKPNLMANYWFRSSLLIALFQSLNTNLLVVFAILDKNINFNGVDYKLALETIANQVFFKENILSSQLQTLTLILTILTLIKSIPMLMKITLPSLLMTKKNCRNIPLATQTLAIIIVVMLKKNWSKFWIKKWLFSSNSEAL